MQDRRSFLTLTIVGTTWGVASLGCGGAKPGGDSFGSGFTPPEASDEVLQLEQQMFERLNRDRAGEGLPPLSYDARLAGIGRAHSADMVKHAFFAHDSPNTGSLDDRLDRAGYLALKARENLAEGPTIDRASDSLLASPGHYANIMADDVEVVGIGIVHGGVGGAQSLTVTQVFATPTEAQDPSDAEADLRGRIQTARGQAGLGALEAHPLLEELAEEEIENLPDDLETGAIDAIGDRVARALSNDKSHGLGGIAVSVSLFLESSIYEIAPAMLDARSKAFGLRAARAIDERGRPAVKLLVLIGQRAS